LDRFASPLAVRPKEASDGFHTVGDVMPLTASAHVVAQAATKFSISYVNLVKALAAKFRGQKICYVLSFI